MSAPILLDSGPSTRGFSRIGNFLRCPQLYAWKYVGLDGKPRKERETGSGDRAALIKGSLIHVGLAHYYARIGAEQGGVLLSAEVGAGHEVTLPGIEPCVLVTDSTAVLAPEEAINLYCQIHPEAEGWRDLAVHCLRSYAVRYLDDAERFRVLAVEVEHRVSLGALDCPGHAEHGLDLLFTSRIDLETAAGFQADSLVYFWDHKSAGRVTKAHAANYSTHGQFAALRMFGVRQWGARFADALLNLVQTDGEGFTRPPLLPAPGVTAGLLGRLRMAEHMRARLELMTERGEIALGEWPAQMHELGCVHRYGVCEHWAQCQWGRA